LESIDLVAICHVPYFKMFIFIVDKSLFVPRKEVL